MALNVSVFIAASLDGFIACEDGGIDWLPAPEQGSSEDYGYNDFIQSIDVIVMGRNTFELVLSFNGWPYGDLPLFVLTGRKMNIPSNIREKVSFMSGNPGKIVRLLEEKGYRHLYIDGGKTIQGFLREGLINRLIITTIPVLLGSGIPLFGPLSHDVTLVHIESKSFANGLVQNRYEIPSIQ